MTFAESAVLEAIGEYGPAGTGYPQMVAASGYSTAMVYVAAHALEAAGALKRPWYGHWMLTDKGKIALALLCGQAARRRGIVRARAA